MSLSNDVNEYIDGIEEDTLSSYPITIEEIMMDSSAFLTSFENQTGKGDERDLNKIYSNDVMVDMISLMTSKISTNNLEKFKEFLDSNNEIKDYVNEIKYSYNVPMNVYKNDTETVTKVNPSPVFDKLGMGSNFTMTTDIWQQLMENKEYLESQYEVIAGDWPKNYNEIVLIVDRNNGLNDYALYSLGIKDQTELDDILASIMKGETVETEKTTYSYDELLNLRFKLIPNGAFYKKENGIWLNKSTDENYLKGLINAGIELKVVGILRPTSDSVDSSKSVGYTSELVKHLIAKNSETNIYKEQLANQEKNIFTNNLFANEMGTSYENNLKLLGYVDETKPGTINIYPKDFESKEKIVDLINKYNEEKKANGLETDIINYTDYVGLLMNSVTSIVDTISYVLIAFVSISLVVSSIMIGIITYVSVLERTKEIGILRAIGASKKDISRVFNAETFIIGIIAGLLGIATTLLLLIPINIIIDSLVDIESMAILPLTGAIGLIIISTLLTMIGGIIPAKLASKKDPVIALRTE